MAPPASSLPGTSETAVNEEVKGDGICVQPAAITRKSVCTDKVYSHGADHNGALQQYFKNFRPSAQLQFENKVDERGLRSTCRVDEVLGVGRAQTEMKLSHHSSLDVVSKMGLAPSARWKLARQFPRRDVDSSTITSVPISRNDQYKRNNFRGALLEHFQKLGREANISFKTAPEVQGRFISKCSFNGIVGTGRAGSKKRAIQLAAFDLICKLKLLPSDEIERQRECQRKEKEIRRFGTHISKNMLHTQRTPLISPSEQWRGSDLLKVLEFHFKNLGRKLVLRFNTIAETNKIFISTCVIDGVKGTGRGCTQKQAIHHAALDLIVKLKVPLPENVKRMLRCKSESKKRRVWRSAGLLYILPSTKAKEIAKKFAVKEQTKTGYRCLLPVPLSSLLAGGHERCRPFKCVPDLCGIRAWMIANIPSNIMAEFQHNKISAGFPGLFFTRLSEKKLLVRLNKVRETHSAICGLETHRNMSRSRGSRIVNMSFTGWGKREEGDKDAMDTARRETLEECGIDIDNVNWNVKLQRISFGEPLYIFIDMERATS